MTETTNIHGAKTRPIYLLFNGKVKHECKQAREAGEILGLNANQAYIAAKKQKLIGLYVVSFYKEITEKVNTKIF